MFFLLFFTETLWRNSRLSKAKWRNDAISIKRLSRLSSERAISARFYPYETLYQEIFSTFFIAPYRKFEGFAHFCDHSNVCEKFSFRLESYRFKEVSS